MFVVGPVGLDCNWRWGYFRHHPHFKGLAESCMISQCLEHIQLCVV